MHGVINIIVHLNGLLNNYAVKDVWQKPILLNIVAYIFFQQRQLVAFVYIAPGELSTKRRMMPSRYALS